jgi:hypothetical protein
MGDENLYFKKCAEIFFFLVLRWQILSPTFVCSEFSLFFTFSEWKGKDLAFWFYSKWDGFKEHDDKQVSNAFAEKITIISQRKKIKPFDISGISDKWWNYNRRFFKKKLCTHIMLKAFVKKIICLKRVTINDRNE